MHFTGLHHVFPWGRRFDHFNHDTHWTAKDRLEVSAAAMLTQAEKRAGIKRTGA